MSTYITSIRKQFEYYQSLGTKTILQLPKEKLFWQPNATSNSIAIIVNHLHGNMLSRWTNFLTEDGEKTWRNRDLEFQDTINNKEDLLHKWEAGWDCLFSAINAITTEDLEQLIYIRNMGHTVTEAINRQMAHYAYHVGQIVFLGKLVMSEEWESLSIPKGESAIYNKAKFAKEKSKRHFTDDL